MQVIALSVTYSRNKLQSKFDQPILFFVLFGASCLAKHRNTFFISRLWVYERSDCCSRTVSVPKMMDFLALPQLLLCLQLQQNTVALMALILQGDFFDWFRPRLGGTSTMR